MTDPQSSAISAGDILRTNWPVRMEEHLNLYMGSGRAGACFDAWGLMHARPGTPPQSGESLSRTVLMHADHWHRGAFGIDCWLPVARLCWAGPEPPPPTGYRQELRLREGCLETELAWPDLQIVLRACFHPGKRDLLAVELRAASAHGRVPPRLLLAPECDRLRLHYGDRVDGSWEPLEQGAGWWLGRVAVGTADSVLGLRAVSEASQVELKTVGAGVEIGFPANSARHLLLIGCAGVARRGELAAELRAAPPAENYFADAAAAWSRRWGDAFVQLPVREYQAMWARSHFYVLGSYAPDVRSPAPPCGWTGNAWPFHFPQDLSFIHPALLRLGHLDIARAWVEFYRDHLPRTLDITRRIYHADGAMWPWEHPIGTGSEMLKDGTPNWCQYEIHNAAYPLRMAYETSQYLGDGKWTREVAWPVIQESARFYGSMLRQDANGSWSLHVTPSMGQDEFGGRNARNYLCALHSARYSLTVATLLARRLGVETAEFSAWRQILDDGLAFDRLYIPDEGVYSTCEGIGKETSLGRQKHPVQLAPLIFLPLDAPDARVVNAYRRRYDLCVGPAGSRFCGWTLSAYWLASVRMADADGLLQGLAQAVPAQYVDSEWIQIFESSGATALPFYVTSHGLYLQAMNNLLLDDCWDGVRIGAACPASWQESRFSNLHVPGRRLSGERDGARWSCTQSASG